MLAIILRCGTKKYSVKDLARELLKMVSTIEELKQIPYEQLVQMPGIGPAQACNLLATIELGKRIHRPVATLQQVKLNGTKTVYEYYRYQLGEKKQEHFYCIYLDQQKKVIRDKCLFIGTVNRSLIHPREIFKEAYLLSASYLLCIHNHPSGNVIPSKEDIEMTQYLVQIGTVLGILIIDHVIIGRDAYYSFYENGMISLSK